MGPKLALHKRLHKRMFDGRMSDPRCQIIVTPTVDRGPRARAVTLSEIQVRDRLAAPEEVASAPPLSGLGLD